ncbi:2-C-methyl-D-erythritol 2,4-cyclodiphosphate synthase [Hibiscus syriacus]|uniref:2-C-methyl-D-erythritol 2,4-cyclodiphosphate synthase n=1 Tax=Hibiscus syriacus TaxID=106335 RepID=A0A6A2XAF3_HIBSY|nr:2-C-methyl-D-erythritol 2,4-cyclodiphosphate synthase [Hibiscus syriacus]
MATHFYSFSPIAAKRITKSIHNKSIFSPNPPAISVAVDGDTTSTKPSKSLPFRVGHGFDLHRLEPGYPLIIGGINIPHDRGCEAHSDGDVLLHCVVDAILGALGLPDIGQIFPDNDPKWKGAASSVFIKEAVNISLIFDSR